MLSSSFVRFWRNDLVRDGMLSFLTPSDLQSMRLVCQDFAAQAAPILFNEIKVYFDAHTFSRQSRLLALERIGHHVKRFSFIMPHTNDSFLPPLLSPDTLEEVTFIYEPHISTSRPTSSSSGSSGSRYGSWEMNDLLIKHYPPLFHSATNIAAFTRAMCAMPCIRDLRISCPDQPAGDRYRKDAVDYALISLRIAVEVANPQSLEYLTLDPIHPGALLCLRPHLGVGTSPISSRVWRRIQRLRIAMDSFAYGVDQPTDHLKILHNYLQTFIALEQLDFQWRGDKGPSPLSLHAEPCTSRPTSLDCSNACPESSLQPACKPIKFRKLKVMRLDNAVFDASQASAFIMSHRKILHEFNFEACHLRSGTWDDALAPLTRITGNENWKQKQEEVMDVPLILSPQLDKAESECVQDAMWADNCPRNRGLAALRKVSLRTKEILPQQVKRLLRGARVGWH